jgi:hypothetical protein
MKSYSVHCFTEKTIGTKFPENSYYVDSVEQVTKIIDDVSSDISGIILVEVNINKGNK